MRRSVSVVLLGLLAVTGTALAAGPTATPRPPAGAELAALSKPPARTSIASQRIYFVMTDRYANGDTSNDRAGLSGGRGTTGYDPTDIGWFHGGDFDGLRGAECTDTRRGLGRLKDLGFTAVWITPPVRQKYVQADSAAYHGYWGLDFTTVDPHLGTEQDFAAFVECAHRLGLKVIQDVVLNHTADVIIPSGGSAWVDPAEVPYRDCRGRKFDPARYVARTFPCLKASNMPRIPVLVGSDRTAKRPAWLNDVTNYHNRGDVDFSNCSPICLEQGDFFGLDDLFTEKPVVMKGLAQVYADWIRKYKIDGFRIDTARHVNDAFFRLWVPRVRAAARAAGVPDFELFGEVFLGNAIDLSGFVREGGLPNVLDFPFQEAATAYAGGDAGARGVATRLADDDYFRTPDGRAPTPPTFLGNHDMGRAAQQIRSKSGGAQGEALLKRVLLGHELMYLLRGAPVVYYGDEVGMIGDGGDKNARQDMFPTQVPHWRTEARVGSGAIGTESSFDRVDHPVSRHLRGLGALRDAHPALSTGATIVRRAQGPILAVSRIDADARHEYLAVFNSGTGPARLTVPTSTPSSAWKPLLGTAATPTSAANGNVAVDVPALGAALYRAEAALPTRAPARPTLTVVGDDLTDFWRVSARVGASGPVSVSFAVRREKGKRWVRLAVDDSPPYRAFLDPKKYRRGERVYLVAVARALDGRTATSRVVPFRVRRR